MTQTFQTVWGVGFSSQNPVLISTISQFRLNGSNSNFFVNTLILYPLFSPLSVILTLCWAESTSRKTEQVEVDGKTLLDVSQNLQVEAFSYLQRVHLEILVGEHANDYAQIAAKDKLTELQLRMRQLLDQVDQITKEQAYQRVTSYFWFVFASSVKREKSIYF